MPGPTGPIDFYVDPNGATWTLTEGNSTQRTAKISRQSEMAYVKPYNAPFANQHTDERGFPVLVVKTGGEKFDIDRFAAANKSALTIVVSASPDSPVNVAPKESSGMLGLFLLGVAVAWALSEPKRGRRSWF